MKRFAPLLLSLAMVLGFLLGMFYTNHFAGNKLNIIDPGPNKLNYLLNLVGERYVDTVDLNNLVEKSLPEILAELDPHSAYFSATSAREVGDELSGKSIDCAYMISEGTGYIHVKGFGETTYAEMLNAMMDFNEDGFENVIIDLRGNRGGYMQTAIQMAGEFLGKEELIVYTEGRKSKRKEYRSDGRGILKDKQLAVLIDEGSASASEIFAGAIQDNDRGIIIGRRSFGKGLVQQPVEFRDGSQVRLTVARYYTPSGRCIQRPYTDGHDKEYENDFIMRYERGEFFSQDSIHQDGPEYYTLKENRPVYGGGGIMPDVFVPQDTTGVTVYYKDAMYKGLIRLFATEYSDTNRERLSENTSLPQIKKALMRDNVIEKFASYANANGLRRRNLQIRKSRALFERDLYGAIINELHGADSYRQYINLYDPVIDAALSNLATD